MYWSTWASQDNQGRIEYAFMDGTHKKVLVNSSSGDTQWPSSLTIDYMAKKLYWCDPRTSVIERIGLDGRDRQVLITKKGDEDFLPFSVAYHNQYIFWTDNVMGNISRAHINTTENSQ